jgi:DNA-binding SARP family transcriptional activator
VNDVRTALEAERLSAELDRNDALLHVGRHQELLGELSSALQRHPLDERVAGQLMLAQYRSGRQAQAFETYRQMRERLVEELGVDPSLILRDAHQQILDGDRGSTAIPLQPDRPSVLSFPRRPTSFIGRQQELAVSPPLFMKARC